MPGEADGLATGARLCTQLIVKTSETPNVVIFVCNFYEYAPSINDICTTAALLWIYPKSTT